MTETHLGQDTASPQIQHWLEANACALSSITFTVHADDMEGNGPLDWTGTVNRVEWKPEYGFPGALHEDIAAESFCVVRAGFDQWSYVVGLTGNYYGTPVTVISDVFDTSGINAAPGASQAISNGIFGYDAVVNVGGTDYLIEIRLHDNGIWEYYWDCSVGIFSPSSTIETAEISEGRITPATLETLAGGTVTSAGTYPTDFTVAVTY